MCQSHAATNWWWDAVNLLLLMPRHELSVYEGQYYVGQHEERDLTVNEFV